MIGPITVGCVIGLVFSIRNILKVRHQKKLLIQSSIYNNSTSTTASSASSSILSPTPSALLSLPISIIGTDLTYNLNLTSDNLVSDSCYIRVEHFDQAVQFCSNEGDDL